MDPRDASLDRVSGTLRCSSGAVEYSRAGACEWRVPCDRIAIVGEFTVEAPGDDYFFLFVTANGECSQASFYAVDRDACLAALSAHLGSELRPALCNSTEFRSRVLWPPPLLGQPLLEADVARPERVLARVAHRLGLGSSEAHLSAAVRGHLGLADPRCAQ